MSEQGKTNCWACDALIDLGVELCPECQMPQESNQSGQEDVSIDDLLTPDSTESKDQPAMPTFDDVPAMPTFDDEPAMPTFDDEPAMPTFDEDPVITDSQDPESLAIVDALTNDMPFLPDIEGLDFESLDEVEGKLESDEFVVQSFSEMNPINIMKFFLPQLVYWTLVFLAISMASVEVVDHNFDPSGYDANDFNLFAEFFLFSWLTFIPMGWYYGFRIRKLGLEPKFTYAILYLVLQAFIVLVFSYLGIYFINGSFEVQPSNSIFSFYFLYTWYAYLVGFFSVGIFLFYLSYSYLWENIFEKAPLSRITN